MKNPIIIYKDTSCEMAEVWFGKHCVMSGNYWDFHPECHGIWQYGKFNSPEELALRLYELYGNCEILRKTYNCETNEYQN